MYTLYGIPNCNTVKKARQWLDENKVAYYFHNYKKEGVSNEKLKSWTQRVSWEKLVNRAGTTWKKLANEVKETIVDANTAEALMYSQNSVIKRPILENSDGEIIAVGFSELDYAAKLN